MYWLHINFGSLLMSTKSIYLTPPEINLCASSKYNSTVDLKWKETLACSIELEHLVSLRAVTAALSGSKVSLHSLIELVPTLEHHEFSGHIRNHRNRNEHSSAAQSARAKLERRSLSGHWTAWAILGWIQKAGRPLTVFPQI